MSATALSAMVALQLVTLDQWLAIPQHPQATEQAQATALSAIVMVEQHQVEAHPMVEKQQVVHLMVVTPL